jgi:adenylate kinase family enzyme
LPRRLTVDLTGAFRKAGPGTIRIEGMRVTVSGTSGSGKTTFAAKLATAIGARHIDLDAINWQAGWYDLHRNEPEEFQRRVSAAAAGEAWVSCGNYSKVRPIILARATHAVWLDYPKWVVMARVFRRSFDRAWTGRELWPGTGNTETFVRWLGKEHPIRWAWDTYEGRRKRIDAEMADPALAHLAKYRLRHPREAGPLIARLAAEGA